MGLNKKDGIDNRKIAGKFQNTRRLNNTFLLFFWGVGGGPGGQAGFGKELMVWNCI